MAEEENKVDKSDSSNDENIILNRKINYSLIRYLWDMLKGYVDISDWSDSKGKISLYDTFNIKRTKYNRIVYTEYYVNLEKTATALHRLTGIEKDIFNGKKAFYIEGIKYEEWQKHFDLFRLRRLIKQDIIVSIENIDEIDSRFLEYKEYIILDEDKGVCKEESIKKLDSVIKEFTSKLKATLKSMTYDINKNSNLFLLYYFIKYNKAFATSASIEMLSEQLNKITWQELTIVTEDSLAVFIKALKVKLKLAEAAEILKGKK